MNAPQGPNDANPAWASSPEQSDNPAPAPQGAPTTPESQEPNPFAANPYANTGFPAPEQGQVAGQYNQYGQPYPAAPTPPSAPTAQWGAAAPQWGQPAPTQPTQQPWNSQPSGTGQPGPAPQWGAPASGQPQWGAAPGGYPQQGGYAPQPGYPQPQFGAPQPNQWGAPAMPPTASSSGNNKVLMWVGIGVAAVVVVGGIVFATTSLGGKTLDQNAAQKGVEQIVTESYGARSVSNVSCPSGQKVEQGSSFQCSLTVDGTPKTVTVTFTDNEGTYEVSRPS
ncbi:DUF4333 domain-containing protein [Rhodococcus sp. ACT016]|uniref:DUF4333 domain-containing protein n=1 Tax=Rhodococcus sp. ACT016 TaxID=3134808 RepID=UPI003D2C4CE5